jgi:hypothetical protein
MAVTFISGLACGGSPNCKSLPPKDGSRVVSLKREIRWGAITLLPKMWGPLLGTVVFGTGKEC